MLLGHQLLGSHRLGKHKLVSFGSRAFVVVLPRATDRVAGAAMYSQNDALTRAQNLGTSKGTKPWHGRGHESCGMSYAA
jgi:hypothetical protein